MDCSPPGSPAHGIFQARVLEWGAIAFSDPFPTTQKDFWAKVVYFRVAYFLSPLRPVSISLLQALEKRACDFLSLVFHSVELILKDRFLSPTGLWLAIKPLEKCELSGSTLDLQRQNVHFYQGA